MGGGFDYGKQGLTHWALEDVAVLRVQPGITIFVPADSAQVAAAVAATERRAGAALPASEPRRSRATAPSALRRRFDPAAIEVVRDGEDGLVLALGAHGGKRARRRGGRSRPTG